LQRNQLRFGLSPEQVFLLNVMQRRDDEFGKVEGQATGEQRTDDIRYKHYCRSLTSRHVMNPCNHHDIEQNAVNEKCKANYRGNDHAGRELHEEDEECTDNATEYGQWHLVQELSIALSHEPAIATKRLGEYELDANPDEEEDRHYQRQNKRPDDRGSYRKRNE